MIGTRSTAALGCAASATRQYTVYFTSLPDNSQCSLRMHLLCCLALAMLTPCSLKLPYFCA